MTVELWNGERVSLFGLHAALSFLLPVYAPAAPGTRDMLWKDMKKPLQNCLFFYGMAEWGGEIHLILNNHFFFFFLVTWHILNKTHPNIKDIDVLKNAINRASPRTNSARNRTSFLQEYFQGSTSICTWDEFIRQTVSLHVGCMHLICV